MKPDGKKLGVLADDESMAKSTANLISDGQTFKATADTIGAPLIS